MGSGSDRYRIELATDPSAVGFARDIVRERLDGCDERLRRDAALVISELVTDAIVRYGGVRAIGVELDDERRTARLSVSDRSPRAPVSIGESAEAVRLRVVTSIANRWGCDYETGGKTLWVEFDLD